MSNLYKQAAKHKVRFASGKGLLHVEDLFDLPLTSKSGLDLDTVAKTVNKELKELGEESFVENTNNSKREALQLKLDIVKDVIHTRQEEAKARTEELVKNQQRQKLLAALENKREEELNNLSPEEIEKRLAELG